MFSSLSDIYDQIGKNRLFTRNRANEIINSLKICDPAAGSGHFLVSALNEIIAIKNDLKILQDRDGKSLHRYEAEVVNDELIITGEDGELFEYNPLNKESRRVQEALFYEKQTIIENCLFGVDINPNSVKICRLRLWIELLKNAYYIHEPGGAGGVLETLPNIDINIKCGNSLVSRFALDADLKPALSRSKWSIDSYRVAVATYRNAKNREQKREMEQLINSIKADFRSEISMNDPKVKRLRKLQNELFQMNYQGQLFELPKKEKAKWNEKVTKLAGLIKKLEAEIEEIKSNKIYENAFEWRFEFPEVLNDDGDFIGFDVVIANPPYIRQEEITDLSNFLKSNYESFSGKSDIYVFFYEKSIKLLKEKGVISFITSGKFFEASYGKPLIDYLMKNTEIIEIINFNDLPVFEEATAYPLIYSAYKNICSNFYFSYYNIEKLPKTSLNEILRASNKLTISKTIFLENDFKFIDELTANIIRKVRVDSQSINEYCGLPVVGVKTGFNDGYLVETSNNTSYIKPYVFGRDIKKYEPVIPKKYIIFPYNEDFSLINIEEYSDLYNILHKHKERLSNRAIIKDGLKNKTKSWFEYQQLNKTIDYKEEFIIYPNVSLGNNFTFSKDAVIDMTGFIIRSNSRYLLAILNSKLVSFLMNIWSIKRRGGYLEYKVQYIAKIPIKIISADSQKPFEILVNKIIYNRKNKLDTSALEFEIDRLVYQLYGLTEEEIEIVEKG